MAYDETLVARIRDIVANEAGIREIKMFGGVCFTVNGHMACGVQNSDLMVRVGPDAYAPALASEHARPMDFTGRPMKGYVYVSSNGSARKPDLKSWVAMGVSFTKSLPPK